MGLLLLHHLNTRPTSARFCSGPLTRAPEGPYLLDPLLIVKQQQLGDAGLLLQRQCKVFNTAQRQFFLQRHHDVLMDTQTFTLRPEQSKKKKPWYLDCGARFKLEGLGLPVLQVHLQNVGQEEEGVPL